MLKTKKCAFCGDPFVPHKTTDKYCSYYCAHEANKHKHMRRVSPAQKERLDKYEDIKIEFLNNPKNKYCPVMLKIYNTYALATEVHHKAGRVGKLLLDRKNFLAVSRTGHIWIHEHPELAYKYGWCKKHNGLK